MDVRIKRFFPDHGFTLIELLVVVSLVGILATLAILNYLNMRARAENAAAISDLKQAAHLETSFAEEWRQFGRSHDAAAAAAHGSGAVLIGPATSHPVIACPAGFQRLELSRGVHLLVHTNTGGSSYSALAKHVRGKRLFGLDSDTGGLEELAGVDAVALADLGVALSVTSGSDFPATAGWKKL